MISLVVAAVLLLIHSLVCLVLWTLMKLGLLPVRGHMLAVIALVPLVGPVAGGSAIGPRRGVWRGA